MLWLTATALAVLLPLAASQCTGTTPASSTPTKPASDPFWSPPANLATRTQGSVFNCRAVNFKPVNFASAYFQYAYKTITANGTSVVAVATLILPNTTASLVNGKFPNLLSYQIPYDSPTSFCGPSFTNQQNAPATTSNTYGIDSNGQDQSPSLALQAGIPVVISDYETASAGFTIGLTAGYGTLNGIRAVLSASGFFTSAPSVALWGYSGGALATEFAVELAGTQASGISIVGAALGGLTPITRDTAIMVNGPHFGTPDPDQAAYNALIPYGLLGLSNENSTVNSWVQSNLKLTSEPGAFDQRPYKIRFNDAKSDQCNLLTGPDYINSNFNNWFNNLPPSGNFWDVPIVSDALNVYGIMGQIGSNGRTLPTQPLYFYKGTSDGVSAVNETDALWRKYCNANRGAKIQYVRYDGLGHVQAQGTGQQAAWQYLQNRFNKQAAPPCSQTTVSS